jgi:hypothetical protein
MVGRRWLPQIAAKAQCSHHTAGRRCGALSFALNGLTQVERRSDRRGMSDNDPNQELFRQLFHELKTLRRRVEWIGLIVIVSVAALLAQSVFDQLPNDFGWLRDLVCGVTFALVITFLRYWFEKDDMER